MTDRGDQKDYSFNNIISFFNDIETPNISIHNLKWRFLKLNANENNVDLDKIQQYVSHIADNKSLDKIFEWTSWIVNKYIDIRWACPSDLYTDEDCYKYAFEDFTKEISNT